MTYEKKVSNCWFAVSKLTAIKFGIALYRQAFYRDIFRKSYIDAVPTKFTVENHYNGEIQYLFDNKFLFIEYFHDKFTNESIYRNSII